MSSNVACRMKRIWILTKFVKGCIPPWRKFVKGFLG